MNLQDQRPGRRQIHQMAHHIVNQDHHNRYNCEAFCYCSHIYYLRLLTAWTSDSCVNLYFEVGFLEFLKYFPLLFPKYFIIIFVLKIC